MPLPTFSRGRHQAEAFGADTGSAGTACLRQATMLYGEPALRLRS